ncbi:uncharacterized protein CANTADRAFT_46581 [Suhomyces tanzawaensis NRRL Y-17324]|uniref:Ribosomal protein L22 n=1 Tax=Suhomyces tanzawaensis NRRL Y-17324 TaxID=984487 RepID=A0A1E4SML0_9ASCO|nr:uncharacterized protein CANTADRAFT_46581 [Suhomyces tanzawaensis NRRL Y-17324]ODV80647.1 hypothetical protein CANTADRAFT_46581 [Suhomyces tanzawaensis NRRL Y-17324]
MNRLTSLLIRPSGLARGLAIRPAPFTVISSNIHTSSPRQNGNVFGELTKKESEPVPVEEDVVQETEVTPKNDTTLQEYHMKEALERQYKIDKYVTPLKKALFDANVAENGFFKNNQIVEHNGSKYKLLLTEEEIDILEPSVYLKSFRIKSSMKKATQVNRFVRGYNVKTAINQLHFNPKKMSTELEKLLKKGLQQSRELGLDEDTMYIQSLWVGSDGEWVKRPDIKGRGRCGIIEHPYVHLRAILRSNQTKLRKEWEAAQKKLQAKPRMFLNNDPLNFKVRPYYKW